MKIINLMDDLNAHSGLLSEHGLCFYMETDDKHYLFDTGASDKFLTNAMKLNIDISKVDALFISHNHYDHIGGLALFMEINSKAKIYIRSDAVYQTFAMYNNFKCHLGQFHEMLKTSDRIIFVQECMQVDDFFILTDTNSNKDYFCQGAKFHLYKDEQTILDEFSHEMFLVYIDNDKTNILSACSHRGIINIIETTKNKFNMPINNIAAGLHLARNGGLDINCSQEYYNNLSDYLKNADIEKLYTCHCTGQCAYNMLKQDIGNKIDYFYVGSEINI